MHLFHKRILEYNRDTRLGANMEEMIELLVQNWNKKVKPGDLVYNLGDVSFSGDEVTHQVLSRLNGKQILIRGNHDHLMHKTASKSYRHFESVHDLASVKVDGSIIVLCHFPMLIWDRKHYGSYHLHGHTHGHPLDYKIGKAMDVGVDCNPDKDMSPIPWEQIKDIIDKQNIGEANGHHHY